MLFRASLAALLATSTVLATSAQQDVEKATFRSSLDLVSVAVVVRDDDGRLVNGLTAHDFEVIDGESVRPIVQFQQGDDADARMAVLVDSSGSMGLGGKRNRSRLAAELIFTGLTPRDTASVFSFDSRIRRLTEFTRHPDTLRAAIDAVEPFGTTRLYDAIVGTVRTVVDETPRTRGIVLLTDGIDTSSAYSARDAATAAAVVDIPVYVLSVGDEPRGTAEASIVDESLTLAELARRTGGMAVEGSTPAQLGAAARVILSELHHQYVLAFAAAPERGWHRLTVKVRRGRVQARSREGYLVS